MRPFGSCNANCLPDSLAWSQSSNRIAALPRRPRFARFTASIALRMGLRSRSLVRLTAATTSVNQSIQCFVHGSLALPRARGQRLVTVPCRVTRER